MPAAEEFTLLPRWTLEWEGTGQISAFYVIVCEMRWEVNVLVILYIDPWPTPADNIDQCKL